MSSKSTWESQTDAPGLITHTRWRGIAYRAGLLLQALGAAVTAVLYPLEHPFYTIGLMLFEAGVLLAAVLQLVRTSWFKWTVAGSVFFGLALQVAGSFFIPEHYAGSVIIAGIGFVCAGAAAMAGREAYCFGYGEGWVLMAVGFPFMVFGNLFGKENRIFNSLGFSLLFLLLLSLSGKKLRQHPS